MRERLQNVLPWAVLFAVLLGVILVSLTLASRPPEPKGKVKLVVWGLQLGEESAGLRAQVEEFERRYPHIEVSLLSMGAGRMNPQKLMTAIVGNVSPDVIFQDRFTIGDWASRDAFRPLDDLIARDRDKPDGIRAEEFYNACWQEACYKGKVYAIPAGTDDRALYYNKQLFREAGVDPNRPPQTWGELLEYAKKLTKRNPDGTYQRIGFIPNYGNSWLYLYSWQNGGEFMSADGRQCTLNNPRTVQALEWLVKVYDELGGAKAINAFASGFQTNEMDPFFIGKVAMKIDGNWVLNNIARYKPDLDFGVAPAPVPTARLRGEPPFEGQPKFITWSGGFSYAIPRGAKHVEEAWLFIKWLTSVESNLIAARAQKAWNESKGRPFVPGLSANLKVNEAVFREFAPKSAKFREPLRMFIDLMQVSKFRPVTFVGQRLWDEHVRAFDMAILHEMTPKQALDAGALTVQRELDKVFTREKYPIWDIRLPMALIALGLMLFVAAVARLARRSGPVGKLARPEAIAGYLFASPWIIGFFLFTAGPILASIVFSFCDYDVLHPPRFVGLLNYKELLTVDFGFLGKAFYNAGYLAFFGIPLGMATGLAIAMLLNTQVRGMSGYRTAYYMPSIVPVVASAVLWAWILNGDPNRGIINAAWKATIGQWFGWAPPGWFGVPEWSKPGLIVMGLWGVGGGMILWLAGLQGVPTHLYEAAELDGATGWAKFRHVTLPMLSPYIFFNLIMGTIGALQEFDRIYILGGVGAGTSSTGPGDSLLVPAMYLFNNAFTYFKMGNASALAWIIFIIILILTLIQLKLAPRWVHYEAEKGK
ncbi:MAG: extracellular solute-binding protein [Armatimonadota bacterium]